MTWNTIVVTAADGPVAPSDGSTGAAAGAVDAATIELRQPMTFGCQTSPASMFNEYCAKKGLASTITVSDKTANGYFVRPFVLLIH